MEPARADFGSGIDAFGRATTAIAHALRNPPALRKRRDRLGAWHSIFLLLKSAASTESII